MRSTSAVSLVVPQVQEQLRALDPELPIVDPRTVDDFISYQRWAQRVFGSMFALGAGARHVWRLATRRASVQLVTGLVIGLAGSFAARKVLPLEAVRTDGDNSATLVVVSALLVVVALKTPGVIFARLTHENHPRGLTSESGNSTRCQR